MNKKIKFTKEEIIKMVNDILEGHLIIEQEPVVRPPVKPIIRKPIVPVKPVAPNIKRKPTSQTIPGPKDIRPEEPIEKPGYSVEKAKKKETMGKLEYQIFNIKMRLGKLGIGDTVRRFTQSLHDFDINVTKNTKDSNSIRSYLAPARGDLEALKGALESLESELNKLEDMIGE